jgi:hypothetical protein
MAVVVLTSLVLAVTLTVGCYIFELQHRRRENPKPVPTWLIWITQVTYCICGVLESGSVIWHWRHQSSLQTQNECGAQGLINPDIGGVGVRLGLYIPMVLTHISLFLGRFCGEEIGTKELGAAQIISKHSFPHPTKPRLYNIAASPVKKIEHMDDSLMPHRFELHYFQPLQILLGF